MGYCGSREISNDHERLLQGSRWYNHSLRPLQQRILPQRRLLAQRGRETFRRRRLDYGPRQQIRLHLGRSRGLRFGHKEVRGRDGTEGPQDFGQDRLERG